MPEVESHFSNSNRCVIFVDHEALPILEYARDAMRPYRQVI